MEATEQYAPYLPHDKAARILDIGFGSGWFLAARVNQTLRIVDSPVQDCATLCSIITFGKVCRIAFPCMKSVTTLGSS